MISEVFKHLKFCNWLCKMLYYITIVFGCKAYNNFLNTGLRASQKKKKKKKTCNNNE